MDIIIISIISMSIALVVALVLCYQFWTKVSSSREEVARVVSELQSFRDRNLEMSLELEIKERSSTKQLQDIQKSLYEKESLVLALTDERATAVNEAKRLKDLVVEDKKRTQEMQDNLRNEFKSLASDILEQKSKQFKETNRESMEHILKPLKDNISDFKSRVEQIYSEENQQRGALKGELKNLMELNSKITTETTNLTNALKGNSKVQGDWGEMILETILDGSNLINGIHYTTQQSFTDDDGNRLRPDVVLNLPDEKQVVIDSKVSLTAFVDYVNVDSEDERKLCLSRHLVSIRRHIDDLGGKEYHELKLKSSPYFVIMFIPNEPAFLAAIQSDSSIWSTAYNKKVIISSPTNLFALLKLVDDLWKKDSQSKHAKKIADEGAKLYDKFVTLLKTMDDVGRNLDKTRSSYDDAVKQLKTGKGNLIGKTEILRKLGVKTSKTIPAKFEDYDQDEVDLQ